MKRPLSDYHWYHCLALKPRKQITNITWYVVLWRHNQFKASTSATRPIDLAGFEQTVKNGRPSPNSSSTMKADRP